MTTHSSGGGDGQAEAHAGKVAGHYYLRGVMEVGSELLLLPDGNFQYMLAYGAADYLSNGKWRVENGCVILDAVVIDKPPFRLLRSEAVKSLGVRVWVKGPGGQPAPNIDVSLKVGDETVEGRTSSEGVAFFPEVTKPMQAAFLIRVYSFESDPFALNPELNDFHFEINGDAITHVPFKNEPLAINKNNLMMTFWGADRPMRYEKQ
jgi:hypothetical protein